MNTYLSRAKRKRIWELEAAEGLQKLRNKIHKETIISRWLMSLTTQVVKRKGGKPNNCSHFPKKHHHHLGTSHFCTRKTTLLVYICLEASEARDLRSISWKIDLFRSAFALLFWVCYMQELLDTTKAPKSLIVSGSVDSVSTIASTMFYILQNRIKKSGVGFH